MANIIPLKDNTGAQFYPQTHEKAVVDSNGVNLQTKLASITTPTYVTAWDGDSTPVVANIPSGVTVTYDGTTYTGTLAASASTANKTYLVGTGTTDNYNRYVTQLNGSTYSWQNIGSTEIDLSDYATKEELGQLSAVPSDFPNIRQQRTFLLYNITDQGKYVSNTNAAVIRYVCEPNRLYKIVNPSGKRLVVGSSPTTVAANAAFENYKVSADNEHLEFTTGPSDVYLYVCYWAKASSAKSAGDALDDLSVTWLTAKDQYSRDKIDAAYNGAVKKSRNLYDPTRHWYEGMNLQTAGQIVGTYDNRGVVFLPVHGLSKITITLLASGVTTTGCRYCWYDNNRAAIGGAVGNIPVYGEENASVLEVPETAYFIGFLVYYAGVQRDSNGAPLCMVEEGEGYTGYVPYNGAQVDISVNRPKDIYVCAKNSAKKYRQGCDYCCDGVNDELTIQAALDAVGTNGTLYLAPGYYYIGSFPQQSDGQYCAIQYRLAAGSSPERRVKIKCFDQTPMRMNGYSQLRRCATLHVTNDCYSNLASDRLYSVIGCETQNGERVWNGNILDCEGIAIEVPGNQKQVIAFDAYYAFCIMMFKCMATAIPTNAVPAAPGVDNCIGIRCTKGSNFGQESQINTCAMYGFGQGIAVSGEHYVITNAKTIYNKYGFTFNWFGSTDGGYSHPNTLINCCSEMDMNYPYFGQNTQNQSLTLIDFNMEHRTGVFAMGGNLATELVPGSWRGTIHYTIKVYGTDGYSITGNSPNMPFWADGHGANVQTVNDAEVLSRSYSKLVNATALKGKKVVCFGDSFTNYTDASNLHYTDYLERITGATMINCGIPGARLQARATAVLAPQNDTEANAALDIINVVRASLGVDFDGTNTYKDVIQAASDYREAYGAIVTRINSIDWSQIDGVIIQGGTNDWTNTALENTVAAINSIIELLLTNQPHLHIWWFTPTVRWDNYSGAASDVADFSDVKQINGKTLKEFSAGIEAAVKDNHIPVCDLYNTLGWTKYNFSNYFPDTDGVHPRKAFDKYAYRIASFIASVKQN